MRVFVEKRDAGNSLFTGLRRCDMAMRGVRRGGEGALSRFQCRGRYSEALLCAILPATGVCDSTDPLWCREMTDASPRRSKASFPGLGHHPAQLQVKTKPNTHCVNWRYRSTKCERRNSRARDGNELGSLDGK